MDTYLKVILILCVFVFLLYKYGTRQYGYWKKKGVRQLKPLPFIGDNLSMFLGLANALQAVDKVYTPFKGERFGGLYIFQGPFLVVLDPDLLKQIMVKDAEHFLNRHDWFGDFDPFMSRNLTVLKDEKWKSMRTVMSTVFTSAKMKDMFKFMNKCADLSAKYLQDKITEQTKKATSGAEVLELDMKDFFSRYGTDVIGSTAFGLEVDSLNNPNNEFFNSGSVIRNVFQGAFSRFMFILLFPKIAKAIGMTIFGEKYNKFFTSVISDTIKEREEKSIIRKDMIHILMEARKGKAVGEDGDFIKGKLPDLSDLDIAAQGIVFFFGGYETIATLLGFVSYELALNPDVQETLQQEIDEVIESENGVTYEGVMHKMKYLDMVIHETLRKWPPATVTDRVVTKKYVIPKTDTSPEVVLDVGDKIWIPISSLHYDSRYFPNPTKFDPERFRDEKNTIKPFTYLPFGEGLRHCIGMRYALMEAKTILVHVLKNFTIVPSQKTQIPIQLIRSPFQLTPKGGFWMGLKSRNY